MSAGVNIFHIELYSRFYSNKVSHVDSSVNQSASTIRYSLRETKVNAYSRLLLANKAGAIWWIEVEILHDSTAIREYERQSVPIRCHAAHFPMLPRPPSGHLPCHSLHRKNTILI